MHYEATELAGPFPPALEGTLKTRFFGTSSTCVVRRRPEDASRREMDVFRRIVERSSSTSVEPCRHTSHVGGSSSRSVETRNGRSKSAFSGLPRRASGGAVRGNRHRPSSTSEPCRHSRSGRSLWKALKYTKTKAAPSSPGHNITLFLDVRRAVPSGDFHRHRLRADKINWDKI